MEKGEGEMFSKVCYVVLGGNKNGDGKGKENVGKIRHDKSSREYALALEMFYSDSIYDICGAS